MEVIYRYDGSFAGFLCCVFESYVNKEFPLGFQGPEDLDQAVLDWLAEAYAFSQAKRRKKKGTSGRLPPSKGEN